ncbi:MAG: methionine synthase [Cenarchaeum symbiont of Oopsacas minuta]|nr:methionine synthase [Cenarchaeum symbiont of Oopsacas minuta]
MNEQRISSALGSTKLRQIPAPLIIGERLNTQGSKMAKRLVMQNDYEGLINLAREQVDDGAHCLDVCVATTEMDNEKEFMCNLIKHLCLAVDAPLVIDSTDPNVIKATLEQIPALPLINSINLEGDGSRFEQIAPLMAKYGSPAIAMCIGASGMAKTPKEKLDVAQTMIQKGEKYGLKKQQFVFDVLTFTLATGEEEFRDAGKNTLEGIRLVHENIPESYTVLGLSNISFGLEKQVRMVINSVFLYHAVKVGLDCAIINAKEIIPYGEIDKKNIRLAEDLIFNRSEDALSDLISHFEGAKSTTNIKKQDSIDESWSYGQRCNHRIVHRLKDEIEKDVIRAISEKLHSKMISKSTAKDVHNAAVKTLNENLLPAMKEVGDKFGSGELILPFVLKSAECMKAAVLELEKYLIQKEGTAKGVFVLGTVQGDVHDIGKNLVKTIFENNGYTVHDLGKQVPLQKFLEKIKQTNADAVGLSALLVATSKHMGLFVDHARKTGMNLPILCGGAAVNSNFINRIAKKDSIYTPGIFYCNTMFDGLKIMDKLVSDQREDMLYQWREKIDKWTENAPKKHTTMQRSNIKPVNPPMIPTSRKDIVNLDEKDIPLEQVWDLLDKNSLFKLSWGMRGTSVKKTGIDPEKLLQEWKKKVKNDRLFEPHIVYGYYTCNGNDTQLQVYRHDGKMITFDFPRSEHERHLCIADYFGNNDTVAFQAVTVGKKAANLIEALNKDNLYTDAYYLHGLAVETAEALAEWTHRRIRSELKIDDRGLRYSWGFPSCPDIGQHHLVWDLLQPVNDIMHITNEGQIVPEQSTAAIVVHHPNAAYFTI